MFVTRLLTTSGMEGPLLLILIAASLCAVDARPQSVGDHRRSDSRDSLGSKDQRHISSAATSRTHETGTAYQEDPFSSRAHAVQSPRSPIVSTNHERQRYNQAQDVARLKERKHSEETPEWRTGVRLPTKNEEWDSYGPPTDSHLNGDNRRSTPHEQYASPPRAYPSNGADVRLGTVQAHKEELAKYNNDSLTRRQAGTSNSNPKEEIVFPGPTKMSGKFVPEVGSGKPNCAQGSTFCEFTDNYPSDYLTDVLKLEASAFKEFFGNDDNEVVQRIDVNEDQQLCPSVEQIVYPKMAQNKEDKWLFVVNQDQYVQGVRVEKCLKADSECKFSESFPLGYKTSCQQKFIFRRLLALNEEGKTHTDSFRLPSCCACHVKAVGAR